MSPSDPQQDSTEVDRDTPVKLPLNPIDALRALLAVDPEAEPTRDHKQDSDSDKDSKEGRPHS